MLENLKEKVLKECQRLYKSGIVILTEGNVSEINPERTHFVIKPSGVPYEELTKEKMVIVNMRGEVVGGKLKPSSDTPAHLEIYKKFPEVGGITHTHSPFAVIFSQMRKPIPCYGTTHADAFFDEVPITRPLIEDEILSDFEANTGKAICEIIDPKINRAILVASHGPFTFAENARKSVDYSLILEKVAMIALLGEYDHPINNVLLKHKHFYRKHGSGEHRYYGQDITQQ